MISWAKRKCGKAEAEAGEKDERGRINRAISASDTNDVIIFFFNDFYGFRILSFLSRDKIRREQRKTLFSVGGGGEKTRKTKEK